MTYQETLAYLFNALPMFHRQGRSAYKKDLTNVRKLCSALGNPENNFRTLHIAGTNGKGSVSHLLAAVFQEHGYKTGLYISPHYFDFRERIKINGHFISKAYISKFINRHKDLLDTVKPSFFEMTVALAFQYFKDQHVDLAIIETGLGGRLDSTNVIQPLLSIITNISWDHADMLGNSLEEIAFEKAGIIKRETPVILGRVQQETYPVFKKIAGQLHSVLYTAEELVKDYHCRYSTNGLEEIEYRTPTFEGRFRPALQGVYQAENLRTVLAACEILHSLGKYSLFSDRISNALENVLQLTQMMGRWQIIHHKPFIVCESAHNEDGIHHLMQQLMLLKAKQLHIVCGFVKDKDLSRILNQFPVTAKYYFVNANIPRALPSEELRQLAKAYKLSGNTYVSVGHGFAKAIQSASNDDAILVSGSIFVVGEVLSKYQKLKSFKKLEAN